MTKPDPTFNFHGENPSWNPLRKMTRLCRNALHLDVKCSIAEKVSIFSKVFRFIWEKILVCSIGNKPASYRRLTHRISSVNSSPEEVSDAGPAVREEDPMVAAGSETDSDLVTLKISLLGDCQIGKTSFVVRTHIYFSFLLYLYICTYIYIYIHKDELIWIFWFTGVEGQVCRRWTGEVSGDDRVEFDK